ncbi:MAG: UDP-N-acetylmuramate dehydrogenase [Spirochaetaceae bacterium]|jgi:UDP-N-acetylmuramate dehydrogenase|nr:UDP-N-acetylmuramate dehydrogenase [Spirochaetaceae bacterium]
MQLDEFIIKNTPAGFTVHRNEPMSEHTTFKTGGFADIYIQTGEAETLAAIAPLTRYAHENNIPVQIIGGGANVVVADSGIRGITINTMTPVARQKVRRREAANDFIAPAGVASDTVAEIAAENSLSGLEFLAGLPGTIGGAVRMNARCWGKSISDVLIGVETMNIVNGDVIFEPFKAEEWAYKQSPYQKGNKLIIAAHFCLEPEKRGTILKRMAEYRIEREKKGHFRSPSAGSVFKNNPAFGSSTGKIIEELGLLGARIGGAQVSTWHGNFIVNTGGARSSDIRTLTEKIQAEARKRLGIELECEILFIGDWGDREKH